MLGKRRGPQCSAFGCSKRKKTGQRSDSEGSSDEESSVKRQFQRTFHLFPANTDRKNTWLANIRRENWKPGNYSLICSDHFLEKDVDRTRQVVRLRDGAIPSRFKTFPSHLKKVSKGRKLPSRKHMDVPDPIPNPVEEMSSSPKHIHHDHTYHIAESPRKLKKDLEKRNIQLKAMKRQIKSCKQKSRRLKKSVNSMKTVVKYLRQNQIISSSCEEVSKQTFSGASMELMKRMTSGKTSGKGCKYTPELKSFALTLQFYSAKAYEFVRRTFSLALPHQSQIRRWYSKIPADHGFTKPAFEALKVKVAEAESVGQNIVCSLMLDEMAIKKHVSWDGNKYRGYVDFGNGIDDDSSPVAKDALVFMAVHVNGSWKVPLAYFFIDGLSGSERANLVKICIERLSDVGVKVCSLTCDGPSCHFTMMSHLGASLDPDNLVPSFYHPSHPSEKIHSSIRGNQGNCSKQDPTDILHAVNNSYNSNITLTNAALIRKYDLQERTPIQFDHDYADVPNVCQLSEYKEAAVSYISGYVARMAEKRILCVSCCKALGSTQNPVKSKFLALKDRGGLFKPTQSVVKVCEKTEKCFNRMLASTDGRLPRCTGIPDAIATSVLGSLNLSSVFRELDSHVFDSAVDDNHVFSLIKTLAKCYCKVRLYHLGKETTQKLSGPKIRKKLTKLVLFKHQ
eukprot:gene21103-23164_t